MARTATVLKPLEVRRLASVVGEHNVGGVDGTLLLRVRESAAGSLSTSWLFKIRRGGVTQRFGLGAFCYSEKAGALTLLQARDAARRVLDDIACGDDPRERLKPAPAAKKVDDTVAGWFACFFEDCEKSVSTRWKNSKSLKDYRKTYQDYVQEKLGGMKVTEVTPAHVAAIISPVMVKRVSARGRLQSLLNLFFRWCSRPDVGARNPALGNPAASSALKELLPKKELCGQVENHPACPIEDLPRFVRLLVSDGRLNSMGAMATLFVLLTCSRQGNVVKNALCDKRCYAEWKDIDLTAGAELWTIPAQKMKVSSNGEHIVPLSRQAVAILRRIERLGLHNGEAVFTSKSGNVITLTAVRFAVRRISAADKASGGNGFIDMHSGRLMTMHGTARADFATWAIKRKDANPLLIENALHHSTDKYNGAYMRTKLAEERRPLMQAWADFLFSECPPDWDAIKA